MLIRNIQLLVISGILVILSGCGTTPTVDPDRSLADRAADHAVTMVGKPYRYGGNTPRGFDCSGLVQYSFARVGVNLPHGTKSLMRHSRPIKRNQLQRGDLLFFTQDGKPSSHVAVYLGGGRFVHSPSSGKNVYVAGFHENYWQRHFTEARRLNVE